MDDGDQFNASICPGVMVGTVVALQDEQIVYAGPIKQAPEVTGMLLLMNAEDFNKLKMVVDRKRN